MHQIIRSQRASLSLILGMVVLAAPVVADARPAGGGGVRASGATSLSRGGGAQAANRGGTSGARANTGSVNSGKVNTGNINNGNVNNGRVNTGNVNTGNINTGNVNVRGDTTINIDNDNGWGGHYDHPIAAGIVVGAAIGATAAVIGARYYSLPPSCVPYPYGGHSYYSCAGVYYNPVYQGTTVTYVVVAKPG